LEKTRETGLLTTMVFFQNVLSLRFLLGGDVEKFNEDKDWRKLFVMNTTLAGEIEVLLVLVVNK
jgi:hypothetical protein